MIPISSHIWHGSNLSRLLEAAPWAFFVKFTSRQTLDTIERVFEIPVSVPPLNLVEVCKTNSTPLQDFSSGSMTSLEAVLCEPCTSPKEAAKERQEGERKEREKFGEKGEMWRRTRAGKGGNEIPQNKHLHIWTTSCPLSHGKREL